MSKDLAHKKELVGWGYVRVSTLDQSNVLHGSMEQQQNRIRRWESDQSTATGIPHKITRFIDEDISGRAESLHKRREYHELVRAIKSRAIDFVVVEKLDRLHRNIIENRKFIDLCDEMGIKFYRLDGGLVDLKDRSSRTSVFIESWMAEEYSLDLVEKITKKGREARVNNGKDNQSIPILGLDEHPTEACFYVINEAEQKIVTDIFRHFCATGDLQKTADYCNRKGYRTKTRYTRPKVEKGRKVAPQLVGGALFDRKNLRGLLVSRKVAGFGFFKDDWNQFPHMRDENGMVMWKFRHGPVVEPQLFETAQAILRKNAKYNHRIYKGQRMYFLSGILCDKDGHRLHGEAAKNRQNFYYVNSKKKYRIRAERIEQTVVKCVGSLLSENGILQQAMAGLFHGDDNGLKELDREIARNERETSQCRKVLEMLASQQRAQIIEQPHLMNDILLEGLRLRQESEVRIAQLEQELKSLFERRIELQKLSDGEKICSSLKSALDIFTKSSSLRKKQLIQNIVPKVVIDEKNDELNFFINPFLDKSYENEDLALSQTEPILTLRLNFGDGENRRSIAQELKISEENGCHSEDKSSGSGLMAVHPDH